MHGKNARLYTLLLATVALGLIASAGVAWGQAGGSATPSGGSGSYRWSNLGGDPYIPGGSKRLGNQQTFNTLMAGPEGTAAAQKVGISSACWNRAQSQGWSRGSVQMKDRFDAMVFGSGRVERGVVFTDQNDSPAAAWTTTVRCGGQDVTITVPWKCGNVAVRRNKVPVAAPAKPKPKTVTQTKVVTVHEVQRVEVQAPKPQPLVQTGPGLWGLVGGVATGSLGLTYLRRRRSHS